MCVWSGISVLSMQVGSFRAAYLERVEARHSLLLSTAIDILSRARVNSWLIHKLPRDMDD